MVDSITKTLGSGSGIDIPALVTSLVDAQYSTKSKLLDTRGETIKAQISTISTLKSGLSGFASALSTLVKSGTLSTQATSSNTAIVKASTLPGKQLGAMSRTLEVRELAAAQVVASAEPLETDTKIAASTLTFQFGTYKDGAFVSDGKTVPPIEIAADSTLTTIAAQINAIPAAGVTASVIKDGAGERIVLKGASGAARAFTIEATGDANLTAALNVGENDPKIATRAADARVAIDGVEVRRTTNTIDDLVPGVRLDLQAAAPGSVLTLGTTPATDAIKQAVSDVVATFNEVYKLVRDATDPLTGNLSRDPAALEMKRQMSAMTLKDLTGATDGSPRTLAEIGVGTARDGSLTLDTTRLTKALTDHPRAVEAMFTDRGVSGQKDGLAAAMTAMSSTVTGRAYGLGAAEGRYTKAQTTLSDDRAKLTEAQEKMKARLTQQYASMDSRVAAYKATQSFLTNQIEAWNKN